MCQRSRSGAKWRRSARTWATRSRPWVRARNADPGRCRSLRRCTPRPVAAMAAGGRSLDHGGRHGEVTHARPEGEEGILVRGRSEHQHSPCADGSPILFTEGVIIAGSITRRSRSVRCPPVAARSTPLHGRGVGAGKCGRVDGHAEPLRPGAGLGWNDGPGHRQCSLLRVLLPAARTTFLLHVLRSQLHVLRSQ